MILGTRATCILYIHIIYCLLPIAWALGYGTMGLAPLRSALLDTEAKQHTLVPWTMVHGIFDPNPFAPRPWPMAHVPPSKPAVT